MKATVDWRKEPRACNFEMLASPEDFEPTLWPASDNYNADRARMAVALGCDYIEVRMETYWMVWAPEEAEARWREDYGITKPAKSLEDFWDERGFYCPWKRCDRKTPGAVKFREGRVALAVPQVRGAVT